MVDEDMINLTQFLTIFHNNYCVNWNNQYLTRHSKRKLMHAWMILVLIFECHIIAKFCNQRIDNQLFCMNACEKISRLRNLCGYRYVDRIRLSLKIRLLCDDKSRYWNRHSSNSARNQELWIWYLISWILIIISMISSKF